MTASLRPPDWTRSAACLGQSPKLWDDETPAAKTICATCPVRLRCTIDALRDGTTTTLRGGYTTTQRRRLAIRLGHELPGAARHGDRSRYVAGCRCPDCRRAHAVYEHARRLRARLHIAPLILETIEGHGRWAAYPGQVLLFERPKPRTQPAKTATQRASIAA